MSVISSPLPDEERDIAGKALQATLVDLLDLSLVAGQGTDARGLPTASPCYHPARPTPSSRCCTARAIPVAKAVGCPGQQLPLPSSGSPFVAVRRARRTAPRVAPDCRSRSASVQGTSERLAQGRRGNRGKQRCRQLPFREPGFRVS
ncbi:hypothetical protein GCM10009760_38010 [Kitasatospora kazusensis]|uniref:Uncharacterized protein n=1 Tax=Kitasatospora kazusensis TaxID=407974 RepID=A0ABP5LHF4_9ACTN